MQERCSIDWHRREYRSHNVANNRYPGLIRSVYIVAIVFVWNDGCFGDVYVHVLEGVCTITQVEEHRLMPELWKAIGLQKEKIISTKK